MWGQGEGEGGRQPANVDVQRRRHICRMRALFGNFLNGSACSQLQLQARRRSDTVRGGTIVCVCSLTASGQTYIMCCIWEWIKNTIKKELHNIVAKNTKHTKLFVCGRALKASRAEHSTEQALFQLIKHFGQTKPQEQPSQSLFRSWKKNKTEEEWETERALMASNRILSPRT